MTDQLLTSIEVGEILAMTRGALAQLRYLGTGPRYVKLSGRSVRYREQDITDWIEASIRTCTATMDRRAS
ncbi:MAG: AlpA family phage regulatory protein [Terrimesophilobacter sp.]